MTMVSVDSSSITAQANWLGLWVGGHLVLRLHSSSERRDLAQWLWTGDDISAGDMIRLRLLRRQRSTFVDIIITDDDDDDDDENRFLDDFSGHGFESKSPYYGDVTLMTSHGHLAAGHGGLSAKLLSSSSHLTRSTVRTNKHKVLVDTYCP